MIKELTFTLSVLCAGCSSHEVIDQSSAVAVADSFYSALRVGDVSAALSFFSSDFKRSVETWPRLLVSLNRQGGSVVSTKLLSASLGTQAESPCFLLAYAVDRQGLNTGTDEKLFVCRSVVDTSSWFITGHSITRHDTGKLISAGVMPSELSANAL
jgi:hypothetical protein